MKRYLLDTNTAGDYIFRRHGIFEKVSAARRAGNIIGIGIPVMAELLAGIECSKTREKNLKIVNRNLAMFRLWPLTPKAAREYARLFAELRRIGRPMQTIDIMIAAIALTLGQCTVVSTDTDLSAVPGLSVENWRAKP